jgi:CheY-like chemotaxis protein
MATVLVVDDDADALEALVAILKSGGHRTVKAESGTAALDILDSDADVDLMLTDIVMPGLNGFNLARMARLRRRDIKILYMTGFHEQSAAVRDTGERLGKLLSKPLRAADLRKEVDAALHLRVPI